MKHLLLKTAVILLATVPAACSDDREPGYGAGGDAPRSESICFMAAAEGNGASRGGSECRRSGCPMLRATEGSGDSLFVGLEVTDLPAPAGATPSRAAHLGDKAPAQLRMTCVRRSEQGYDYYFSNTIFTDDGSGTWVSDPAYWWLDENTHFKFYGYAPAEIQGATYVGDKTTFIPALDYTVPANAARQTDIVYHTPSVEYIATARQVVPLTLNHALAAIGFKTGSGMAAGTINSITINNVTGRGTLDLATGQWTLDAASTISVNCTAGKASADGLEITTDPENTFFMLLPGSSSASTTVDIDFTGADGVNRVYSGPLTGTWEAGRQYMYTISIHPDLDITIEPDTQDAHYVRCQTRVEATNLQPGQQWTLTATASDGADVTLLTELDEFQRNGFWIDRIIDGNNGNRDMGSARGASSLSGSASTDVYIFIPENVAETQREITLTLTLAGSTTPLAQKTFRQHHPAWTAAGHGWEQTNDTPATEFGFLWNYQVYYGYLYTAPLGGNNQYRAYCQSIIDENNAGGYASVVTYRYGLARLRYSIFIDYSKLSALNYVNSPTNGQANTSELYSFAGTVVTNSFETVVSSILKTESGHTTEVAFRKGDGSQNEAPAPVGDNVTEVPAVGECMKKNRWNLLRTVTTVGGTPNIANVPQIKQEDIVWYLPAVEQFSSLPITVVDPVTPASCWSSNVSTTDNTQAYLGSNALQARLSTSGVRACRNHP